MFDSSQHKLACGGVLTHGHMIVQAKVHCNALGTSITAPRCWILPPRMKHMSLERIRKVRNLPGGAHCGYGSFAKRTRPLPSFWCMVSSSLRWDQSQWLTSLNDRSGDMDQFSLSRCKMVLEVQQGELCKWDSWGVQGVALCWDRRGLFWLPWLAPSHSVSTGAYASYSSFPLLSTNWPFNKLFCRNGFVQQWSCAP